MKASKGWLLVLFVAAVSFGGWYIYKYGNTAIYAPQPVAQVALVKGQVGIMQNAFSPDPITVKVGDTVTWINNESYAHTVVSDTGLFKSPSLATGDTFSYKFTKVGTFPYSCSIHPFMHGSVIVTK